MHALINFGNFVSVLRSATDCSTDALFEYCRLIKYKSINDPLLNCTHREREEERVQRGSAADQRKAHQAFYLTSK